MFDRTMSARTDVTLRRHAWDECGCRKLKPVQDLQYEQLAKYYDMVRKPNDYKSQAKTLKGLISKYKVSSGKALLDVGCGTGGHLKHLVSDFDCTGLDLHEGMLRIARENISGVRFSRASMIDFRLGRKFDIILCMYSTICLVRTYRNLERTIRNFSNHLRKGGIVILESDSFSDSGSPLPHMNLVTAESSDTKIAKLEYYQRRGNVLVEREDYLVAERGKGIKHYADLQYAGMFGLRETMQVMLRTGLEPIFLKRALRRDVGLLIGTKVI